MARVICCYQKKVRSRSQKRSFGRVLGNEGIKLSSTTRIRLRQNGSAWLPLKGQGLSGVTFALVQGYTAGSLPWLISIKNETILCDSIHEEYITGVEWEVGGLVDRFWKYDVVTERDGGAVGKLKEYAVVTFSTRASAASDQDANGTGDNFQETLRTIKIYLPPKEELVPPPKAMSYLGTFLRSVLSTPQIPAPRVVHHDGIDIPNGFICEPCPPATDGSLVYLLAQRKQEGPDTNSFWVFVYDWGAKRGFQIHLPQESHWCNIAGLGHIIILQDGGDRMYTMNLSSELTKLAPSPPSSEDGDVTSWRLVEECPEMTLVHIPLDHRDSDAKPLPPIGNTFQVIGELFCRTSRLGERLYFHLFKPSPPPPSEASSERLATSHSGFTHLGSSCVHIGDGGELGDVFLCEIQGPRTLLGYSRGEGTRPAVEFFVVDFEIDFDQDGTHGPPLIRGTKQKVLVGSGGWAKAAGSSAWHLGIWGSKAKGVGHILGGNNLQEVFYDEFRGTVGIVNKEYSEIVLFRVTRD